MSSWSYPIVEVTPQIRAAVAAIDAMYDQHPTGGAMHVVTDDWNIDDDSVEWCGQDERAALGGPMDGLERACFGALRRLNEDERATALALRDWPQEARDAVTAERLHARRQNLTWTPTRNHVLSIDRDAVPWCSCGRRWPEVDGEDAARYWDAHVEVYDRPCGPSRESEQPSRFEELHNKVLAAQGKPPIKW